MPSKSSVRFPESTGIRSEIKRERQVSEGPLLKWIQAANKPHAVFIVDGEINEATEMLGGLSFVEVRGVRKQQTKRRSFGKVRGIEN